MPFERLMRSNSHVSTMKTAQDDVNSTGHRLVNLTTAGAAAGLHRVSILRGLSELWTSLPKVEAEVLLMPAVLGLL